ncbi:hypothetical protein [uncultured Sphingomonas sp.]|uniref:hypothetical protein n=1 Tax=uncultured Sphingomonas sp. TaxID=158754 RepID=UPI002617A671|nr:hypothetical protein [uncultured Sphingomonas sp.]
MYNMPIRRPNTGADPLPRPRQAIRNVMMKLAADIGGPVDLAPEQYDPCLAHCLLLPQAMLVIGGTPCWRPLVATEAARIADATGYDLILVRYDAGAVDYDLLFADHGGDGWLERCTARRGERGLEFVPASPAEPIVRVSQLGLVTCRSLPAAPDFVTEGC